MTRAGGRGVPLLTQREDQVFWTCPFGALGALILQTSARPAEAAERKGEPPGLAGWVYCAVKSAICPMLARRLR